jgi:hypothetical protein
MVERTPGELDDDETFVDRSVSFVKQISQRLREQAGRRWRSTNLSVDAGLLRRRRRQALLSLGEAAYEMIRSDDLDLEELKAHADQVYGYERRILETEQQLDEVEQDRAQELDPDDGGTPVPARRRGRPAR